MGGHTRAFECRCTGGGTKLLLCAGSQASALISPAKSDTEDCIFAKPWMMYEVTGPANSLANLRSGCDDIFKWGS